MALSSSGSGSGAIRYSGSSGPLFKLAFSTGLLTILTLGIYRFWAKTRLRRYFWSSTSIDRDAFEYTGTGLEKLLGFLVAIVFLAIYLGAVQLLLTVLGLGLVLEPQSTEEAIAQIASIYISFFALVPFLMFAVYRARRYKLARTRLRGIRFGMDNAAWGYAFRAIGLYLLAAVTLGLLIPYATFSLEKYMTDRSHYGSATFAQGGKWTALYAALKHVLIGFAIVIASLVVGLGMLQAPALGGLGAVVGYVWLMVGFVYYRVRSFAYLTGTKTLAGSVTFTAAPRTGEVIRIVLIGGLLIALAVGVAVAALGGVFYQMMFPGGDMQAIPSIELLVLAGVLYLLILVAAGALGLVWITQPMIAHLAETTRINNVEALAAVRQRDADKGADAEGFADALDVGGAI